MSNQEKELDADLMQLSLVDIANSKNSIYSKDNRIIEHILDSQISYRLVYRIIRMASVCYLKPYQLQSVMCYAEQKYHSNDFTFMQIMADVLNVTKMQIKQWKEQKQQKLAEEESKSQSSFNPYTYVQVQNSYSSKKEHSALISISEKMARDKTSDMIGSKIIGKVFNDNLRDFKKDSDMEPIQNICSIIIRVLVILKELNVKQKA